MTNLKLTGQQIQQVAKAAGVDVRTMVRFLAGDEIRKMAGERIRKVLTMAGLLVVLLIAACSSSSDGATAAPDSDPASRGAMITGTATATRTDAGTAPDALVLADARPADTLAPVTPDTMPAQPADALVALDTLPAVAPDALAQQPDTFRPTDAKPATSCKWSRKDDGQVADVHLTDSSDACGMFGSMRCRLGCTAISVEVGGGIERLTPARQPMEIPVSGCKASFMFGDAAVEAPGLCFPDAEACSKFCQ